MALASPLESIESTVIWLLVAFSVATWGLALLKGVQFGRLKAQDRKFHKQFWAASSLDSAAELAETQPGAAARVAQAGYAAIQVGDTTHAADLSQAINHQDRLERALRQQIVRERRSLETGLAVVASIGSTSPFIGLFGTVWGIMEALKGISAAGSASLETVAGPIGAALVATGVGIAVAVPAVLVYNYFLRRLKLTAADLDDFAHDFYSEINVTPLVDVMLVLLVVFIVTAPLLTNSIPINLPMTQAVAPVEQKDPLVVSIDGAGKLFINKDEIQPDLLEFNLQAAKAKDPDVRVQLQADDGVNYGEVARAMASIERAGITKLSVITAR